MFDKVLNTTHRIYNIYIHIFTWEGIALYLYIYISNAFFCKNTEHLLAVNYFHNKNFTIDV